MKELAPPVLVDSERHYSVDPRNDSAIFAVRSTPDGLDAPNNKPGAKCTGTEEALYLLGAGKPYGE